MIASEIAVALIVRRRAIQFVQNKSSQIDSVSAAAKAKYMRGLKGISASSPVAMNRLRSPIDPAMPIPAHNNHAGKNAPKML